MNEEQLFEWDVTPRRKPRRHEEQELVPRPPGYHLVANTKGVIGFHRTRIPEAAMASHGSVVTYCGHLGRRLSEYPDRIPLCKECEEAHARK